MALTGVSPLAPLKNRAVSISAGTSTSLLEVLVRVTVRVLPEATKLADALRFEPLVAVNSVAIALVANRPITATQTMLILIFLAIAFMVCPLFELHTHCDLVVEPIKYNNCARNRILIF